MHIRQKIIDRPGDAIANERPAISRLSRKLTFLGSSSTARSQALNTSAGSDNKHHPSGSHLEETLRRISDLGLPVRRFVFRLPVPD